MDDVSASRARRAAGEVTSACPSPSALGAGLLRGAGGRRRPGVSEDHGGPGDPNEVVMTCRPAGATDPHRPHRTARLAEV